MKNVSKSLFSYLLCVGVSLYLRFIGTLSMISIAILSDGREMIKKHLLATLWPVHEYSQLTTP